jgi:hypothetical protein
MSKLLRLPVLHLPGQRRLVRVDVDVEPPRGAGGVFVCVSPGGGGGGPPYNACSIAVRTWPGHYTLIPSAPFAAASEA